MLLLIAKKIGIIRYFIFLIFLENQTYPYTNHFDTTCIWCGLNMTTSTYIRCTPTKQETSDTSGKMSFWYDCKEHTFSFNLVPKSSFYFYFLRYDHFCMKPWPVSLEVCFSEIALLKFTIQSNTVTKKIGNYRFFCGKLLEN